MRMPTCRGDEEVLAEVRWRRRSAVVFVGGVCESEGSCVLTRQPTAAAESTSGVGRPASVRSRLTALARTCSLLVRVHFAAASRLDWEGTRRVNNCWPSLELTATMAALRTSLSPSAFALHSRQFQRFLALPAGIRHASSAPPPKPRLLEKPDRFNPPSHPSRLRSKHRSYGAPLSDHERKAQKTRSYPHMMPAEGTFTHWFLTNKSIHLWISIVCSYSSTQNHS